MNDLAQGNDASLSHGRITGRGSPLPPALQAQSETVTLVEPFIALVRERIGAPGLGRRRRETPSAAPAGATP